MDGPVSATARRGDAWANARALIFLERLTEAIAPVEAEDADVADVADAAETQFQAMRRRSVPPETMISPRGFHGANSAHVAAAV